jgi:hypothetical protein
VEPVLHRGGEKLLVRLTLSKNKGDPERHARGAQERSTARKESPHPPGLEHRPPFLGFRLARFDPISRKRKRNEGLRLCRSRDLRFAVADGCGRIQQSTQPNRLNGILGRVHCSPLSKNGRERVEEAPGRAVASAVPG